jgi:hypothetical protein
MKDPNDMAVIKPFNSINPRSRPLNEALAVRDQISETRDRIIANFDYELAATFNVTGGSRV